MEKEPVLLPKGFYNILWILGIPEKPLEDVSILDFEYLEKESMRFELHFDYDSMKTKVTTYIYDKRWNIHYDLKNREHLEELFTEVIDEIHSELKNKVPLFKCEKCGFTIDKKPPVTSKERIENGVTIIWCEGECPNCKTNQTSKCKICNKTLVNYYHEVCCKCHTKALKKCNRCIYQKGCCDNELGEIYEWCEIYRKEPRLKKFIKMKHADDLGKVKDCKFYTPNSDSICSKCSKDHYECGFYSKFNYNPKNTNKCVGFQKANILTRIKRSELKYNWNQFLKKVLKSGNKNDQ